MLEHPGMRTVCTEAMSRSDIGKALCVLGLCDRPLSAGQIYKIERSALRKLRKRLMPFIVQQNRKEHAP